MSERASYFKLGLFVIIATAVILGGLFVLGAGAFLRSTFTVETYLEESVQGLDVGAPVKHRGVRVGKVSRIGFVSQKYDLPTGDDGANILKGYVLVEMAIDMKGVNREPAIEALRASIRSGLHARMASTGLMGAAYIELAFVDQAATPDLAITWEPYDVYIPAAKSVIAQITSAIESFVTRLEKTRIDELIEHLDVLAVDLDRSSKEADVAQLQEKTTALIDEMRDSNRRLKEILDNPAVNSTLDDLSKTAASFRKITGEGESDLAQFVKDLPQLSQRLKSAATQVDSILADEETRRMLADLATTARSASPAAADLQRLARRLDTLISSQQQDLAAIVAGLRRAMQNAQGVSEDASSNPSRLLFGEPPPRVDPSNPGAHK